MTSLSRTSDCSETSIQWRFYLYTLKEKSEVLSINRTIKVKKKKPNHVSPLSIYHPLPNHMTGVMRKGPLSFNVTILRKRRQSLWIGKVKIAERKHGNSFVGCIRSTFFVRIHCLNWVPIWKKLAWKERTKNFQVKIGILRV